MKALDKEGLDYLANKVYDAINSGGSADYIVEQGTMLSSDNVSWTYRKWASGIAECWGKDTNHTSVAGAASNVTYLPNIFYTAPIATLSQSTTTIADSWVKYARVPATPSNGSYYINWYVYAAAGDKSIELMIDVKGFWKEFTPSVSARSQVGFEDFTSQVTVNSTYFTTSQSSARRVGNIGFLQYRLTVKSNISSGGSSITILTLPHTIYGGLCNLLFWSQAGTTRPLLAPSGNTIKQAWTDTNLKANDVLEFICIYVISD